MKAFKKILSMTLALIMLVSVCPVSIFAADNGNKTNAPKTYSVWSDDYYHRYTFDNAAVESAPKSRYLNSLADADSNPYNMSIDGTITGMVQSHGDGSGNYFAARYVNVGWGGMRFSLVNGNNDYTIANGVESCFRFRWVGTGEVSDGAGMTFFAIRRAKASGRFDFSLLRASVDQTTGELIIKAARVYYDSAEKKNKTAYDEIYRIPKMSDTYTDFTEFRVIYHDVTNTYSVYINGKAYVEGLRCEADPRTAESVTTTYDTDFFATRTPVANASDKWSLQMFRIDQSGSLNFRFHFDVDDIVIREGDWYTNSFETAGSLYNTFDTTEVKAGNHVFNRNGTAGNVTVRQEKDGDNVVNQYLYFPAGSRIDVKDSAYQIFQDGNWTVDFKLRADGAVNVMRLFDRVNTRSFLNVQADRTLKLGNCVIPDVVVPTTDSDEWLHLTVSILVDDVEKDEFTNFISLSKYSERRNYRIALWIDGVYVGTSSDYGRNEVIETGSDYFLLNDSQVSVTDITVEPDVSGYTLISTVGDIKTYFDSTTNNYYQLEYKNGEFTRGKLLTHVAWVKQDILGIWDKGSTAGAIDDFTIYKGVGPKSYSTDKVDTTGVISDFEFGSVAKESVHQMTETPHNSGGGVVYVNATNVNSGGHYIERVAATATDSAYVKFSSNGTAKGHLDLRADNSGGKVFAANFTLKNFSSEKDIVLFMLRRQQAGTSGFVSAKNILAEAGTGYVYYKINNVKYYICDENAVRVCLKDNTWTKLTVVFDETGAETLVSFLVNDEVAYSVDAAAVTAPIPYPSVSQAVQISGVVSADAYNSRNYLDQRVRIYNADAGEAYSFDALSASVEYAEVPTVTWNTTEYSDAAFVDFSKYNNIDEFKAEYGNQFYISGNVTIENGVLNIPAGAKFAWLDINGVFADHWNNAQAVEGLYVNGYTIEMSLKTDFTGDGLVKINGKRDGTNYTGKIGTIKASGDVNVAGESKMVVNKLSSDRFSDVVVTFTNDTQSASVKVDGTYVGTSGFWKHFTAADKYVSFELPANTQLSKFYIHADIASELAKESGEILRIDPSVFVPSSSGWPRFGITNKNSMLSREDITSLHTYESDDESFMYYSLDFKHPDDDADSDVGVLSGHDYFDVYLTDYLEDRITIIDFKLRFTPHEKESLKNMELVWFRRTTGATKSNHFGEGLLYLTGKGILIYNDMKLCDAGGEPIVLSAENWTDVAVIYDATAGQVSFRIGGKIPYYLVGDELVLADKIQLSNPTNYRLDSFETRMRTFSVNSNADAMFLGRLDVAYLDIYTVDSVANAAYVGVQKDTADNNLRLVAGLDHTYYSRVGFEVEALDVNGNVIGSEAKKYDTNIVYSSITEYVDGNESIVYPEDYGYRYFYTANVTGVATNEAVKLKVTPYTVVNGVQYKSSTVVLDIDFTSGNINDWNVGTKSIEVKPTGTNSSKDVNFSTTEVITYTNDGAFDFNGRNAEFAFAADLEGGVVSVNLTNAFGEVVEKSILDVYMDGVLVSEDLELAFGHHTLVLAEGLTGKHSFKIVKKTGGDYVRINNISVTGEIVNPPLLSVENAVNVVVHKPEAGASYGSANVYVRTSDASGKYYINYQFTYINWGLNDYDYSNGKSNSHNNAKMYRINTATLVEKTATGYEDVFEVLQGGEISLAIKEVWNGKSAADFVGGWHGDENIENGQIYWFLDGESIDITKAGNYTGTQLVFDQTSLINRCDTEETVTMRHRQYMVLDTNGLRNNQSVEFLVGDFVANRTETYLEMCTFNRQNFSLSQSEREMPENYICDAFNMLDANGGVLSSHDLSNHYVADGNKTLGSNVKNRYVEYLGNNNGLYGLVGYVIDDRSAAPYSVRIQVRETQGDNKLYASFANHFGAAVPKYEVWNIDDYYFIDYNTANIVTESN